MSLLSLLCCCLFVFPTHHILDRCTLRWVLLDWIHDMLAMFDQLHTFLLVRGWWGWNIWREKQGDGNNLTNVTIEIYLIKWSLYRAALWLPVCQVEGQKAQSSNHSVSFFLFFQLCFQLICHGRQLSQDIKLSGWHFVCAVNQPCHLESELGENLLMMVEGEQLIPQPTCNISGSHWKPPAGSKPVVREWRNRRERLESHCSCHTISANWFPTLWPSCGKLISAYMLYWS